MHDACHYLGGVSEKTLRRLIARGEIKPCSRVQRTLISKAELDRFLASTNAASMSDAVEGKQGKFSSKTT